MVSRGETVLALTARHCLPRYRTGRFPEGQAFTLTASAADAAGGNILRYSLDGAPAGTFIDPVSGVFSWTPTEAQGPGVYAITVLVTDNGSPAMTICGPSRSR